MQEETATEMAGGFHTSSMVQGARELYGSGRSTICDAPATTIGLMFADNIVENLLPGGPAWIAGIRKGDTIVAVDGKEDTAFKSSAVLQKALSQTDKVGDRVHVNFVREGIKGLQTATIVRSSAARVASIRDWMELQADAATHVRKLRDETGVLQQKELLQGMIQILSEQKMFEAMMDKRIKKLTEIVELHLDASHELLDRLEGEDGIRENSNEQILRDKIWQEAERKRQEELQRMRCLLTKSALLQWKKKSLTRAWGKWRAILLCARRARKAAKAAKVWLNRCAGAALSKWHHEIIRARKVRKALKMWLNRACLQAHNSWTEFVHIRKCKRAMAQRAVARMMNRALAGASDLWTDQVARIKKLRQLIGKTVQRWKNVIVGRCFSKWYVELVSTGKAKKAAKMWLHRYLAMGWRSWLFAAAQNKRLRLVAAKVVARWKNGLLSSVWTKWDSSVAETKRLRAMAAKVVAYWKNRLLSSVWTKWDSVVAENKRLRAVAAKVVKRWLNGLLAGVWTTWYDQHDKMKKTKKMGLRILKHWKNRTLATCWTKWHQVHQAFAKARLLATRALQRWLNAIMSRCFQKLHHEVRRRHIAQRVAAIFMRKTLSCAWRKWEDSVLWEGKDAVCKTCRKVGGRQIWDDTTFTDWGTWEAELKLHAAIEQDLWDAEIALQEEAKRDTTTIVLSSTDRGGFVGKMCGSGSGSGSGSGCGCGSECVCCCGCGCGCWSGCDCVG